MRVGINILKKLCWLIVFITACNGNGDRNETEMGKAVDQNNGPESTKHNYVVLLDLSDRIIAHPDQLERDKAIITSIFQCFKAKAKESYYIHSRDEFKVLIVEQNDMPVDILPFEDKLRINMETVLINKKRTEINGLEDRLEGVLDELYKKASTYKSSIQFKGAKMWKYFNEGLATDLVNDDAENYLFIVTDGYLDFEDPGYQASFDTKNRFTSSKFLAKLRVNNWEDMFDQQDYGLMNVKKDFPNLSVMVLEMNPKYEFLEELALLQKMWNKWLNEMGVVKNKTIKREALLKIQEDILSFLGADYKIPPPDIE